jgi:heme exporter protein D
MSQFQFISENVDLIVSGEVAGISEFISVNVDVFVAIGAIATAVSVIWLVVQTLISRKAYIYSGTWQERNKAAELAKFYQHNILEKVSYVDNILVLIQSV